MKKTFPYFLLLFMALVLAGCKEDDPQYTITPKSQIIFDDNIDKVTADYKKAGNLSLKVSIVGSATSVRIESSYSVAGAAKTKLVGTFPVTDGVASVNVPSSTLSDTEIVGATSNATTRPANTFTLAVDAINPDANSDRRYFTAVVVQ
ncbi:hypothetical protein [Hymenobacter chitinivorans]|uniref:Calx-beta domain-containing protein n=1 Tax=Hymenobacter chitinivorans DSM 11115 TaxID=1121954 RepID=A0A2M9BLQ8_9BACT|nr:hypothetical protein [Hymenobacter chitinivorans]PJJ58850.1 hypothetical protein CLV45_0261 [Hymenobacter chitinivorans DSM 11115]